MKAPQRCLLALLLWVGSIFNQVPAQDTAPSSATNAAPSSPVLNLADLKQHPEKWPAQVALKDSVRLTIVSQGAEVGAIMSPAGSTVNLISVGDTTLQVGVGAARASIAPDQTDLADRIAPAVQTAAPASVPATTAAPLTPVASTPPPAPAPTAPVPPASPPASSPGENGAPLVLDVEIPPRDNFTKAAFRFWSPPYAQPLRGIIVMVPGLNGDGRAMIGDAAWQALALKYRLALVACYLQGEGYHNALRGTGQALLDALAQFAKQSNRSEVPHVPLLLWGESAGGQFDYNFTLWKPELVMAFVVNKGGYYVHDEPDSRMRAVPGLFYLGQKDSDLRIKAITDIWTNGRERGALWALTPQQNSGHEFSKTAAPARVFFEAVLKARLPDDSGLSGDTPLMKPMDESQGWTGDLVTHEIHAVSTGAEPDHHAAWLPDQSSAEAWKAFVSSPN
jgi:hypothetical protein